MIKKLPRLRRFAFLRKRKSSGSRIKDLEQKVVALQQEISRLRSSEEKYKNIFETIPVSIQVVDEKGIIAEVNPFHVKHIGKGKTTKEDYLGHHVVTRPSIVQAGLSEKYRSVLGGESIDEREVYFPMTTGGTDAYHNVRGVPLVRDGKIRGALFITEDITLLKRMLAEILDHRSRLEELVASRTLDLQKAYQELDEENKVRRQAEEEKEKLIAELREVLNKVKTLTGLLPICSSCKKIRDDKGYWNQIESYIRKHSEAEFSHGICPECAEKLYPDYDLYP